MKIKNSIFYVAVKYLIDEKSVYASKDFVSINNKKNILKKYKFKATIQTVI